jgi:hypothetical protein
MAFNQDDNKIKKNYLSPQLVIPQQLFQQKWQQVALTDRWLNPDIVGFFGGTGGNIAGNILSFSDLNQFLTEKLFVSFIISPHDDGGSSVNLQNQLYEYLGYTLSAGDTNNIFSGLTSYFKKRILRTRFAQGLQGEFLQDKLEQIILQIEDLARPRVLNQGPQGNDDKNKVEIEGKFYSVDYDRQSKIFSFNEGLQAVSGQKIIFGQEQFMITDVKGQSVLCFVPDEAGAKPVTSALETDKKWIDFKKEILRLASIIDKKLIDPDTRQSKVPALDISGGSMGNFLITAKMLEVGAYNPEDKDSIDQEKYHKGIAQLCNLLEIENGFVSFSTFDPATLYVKLSDISMEKGGQAFRISNDNINELSQAGIFAEQVNYAEGVIDLNVKDVDLKIREYLEGHIYRDWPGRENSFSEVIMSLENFKKNPVIEHNGVTVKLGFKGKAISDLLYRLEEGDVLIESTQIDLFSEDQHFIFGLPEELKRLPDTKKQSLPRFFIDKEKEEIHIVLDTKGIGVGLSLDNEILKIKSRLIIEQTNITESLHHSGIIDFGFINRMKPKANSQSILAIKNTPLLIMGPGSQYTSLMSLPLIPEIVEALKKRRIQGKDSLFIFNAVRDNESVDNENISQIVRDVERVSGAKFGEIFNHAVVNDIESLEDSMLRAKVFLDTLGPSSPEYPKALAEYKKYSQLIALLDEIKDKKVSTERRSGSFSKLAKYSRGKIGFDRNDLSELILQNVEVHKTKVVLSEREVRKAGKAGKEVSIRYDNFHIAAIIDEILWKKGALFKQDKKLAELKQRIIKEHFLGDESEYDKAIERIRSEGLLKSRSPAEAVRYVFNRLEKDDFELSDDQKKSLINRNVIITNLKHTLAIRNGITSKIKIETEKFLRRGGKMIVVSGFDVEEINDRFLKFIDKSLWDSIILVSNYGTEAWYWDNKDNSQKFLFTSFYEESDLSPQQKDMWHQILENTIHEYGLDKPLFFKGYEPNNFLADVEDRNSMLAIRLGSRRYLPSLNMITVQNYRLVDLSLPTISDDGILRTPMIERLNKMFSKYGLPVTAVPGGTGTINTMIDKAADKGNVIKRVLWAAKDKGLLPSKNLEKQLLIMGKGNFEIAYTLEADKVPWVVFQVPRKKTQYVIEYQKRYGVKAAELFLQQLNSIQSAFHQPDLAAKKQVLKQFSLIQIEPAI